MPSRPIGIRARFGISLAIMLASLSAAFSFDDNATPYDPTDMAAQIDAMRSSSRYFILDALLPHDYQRALDDRKFIGITSLNFSGSTSLPMYEGASIYANDQSIMSQSALVCSSYAHELCYDIGRFYAPHISQMNVTGLFALDGSTILQWGVNTGFQSSKLTVSPAVMIGLAKRYYFSDARDSHVILEASTWLGETVKHRPCLDDYNREFFCGNISAWSDFSYNPHPKSNFLKITFEKLF